MVGYSGKQDEEMGEMRWTDPIFTLFSSSPILLILPILPILSLFVRYHNTPANKHAVTSHPLPHPVILSLVSAL